MEGGSLDGLLSALEERANTARTIFMLLDSDADGLVAVEQARAQGPLRGPRRPVAGGRSRAFFVTPIVARCAHPGTPWRARSAASHAPLPPDRFAVGLHADIDAAVAIAQLRRRRGGFRAADHAPSPPR